jgi:hypothetical protein
MSETVEPYPYMAMAALIISLMYGELMRLAKVGMTLVGTSIIDERAFVTMTFVQNCLGANLRTHLPLCVRMKLQEEYDEETFPCFVLQLASKSIFLVMHLQVHFCRRRKAFGGEK